VTEIRELFACCAFHRCATARPPTGLTTITKLGIEVDAIKKPPHRKRQSKGGPEVSIKETPDEISAGATQKNLSTESDPWHRRARRWLIGAVAATVLAGLGAAAAYWVTRANEVLDEPSVPIAVNVNDDVGSIGTFHDTRQSTLVSEHPASPIPAPNRDMCASPEFRTWSLNIGGTDYKQSRFRLTLQGQTDKAVFISDVTAQVRHRTRTDDSVELICETTGGSAQIRDLAINLDSTRPAARYQAGRKPFGFTLSKGESEIFDITAYTERSETIEWNLKVGVTVGGKHREIPVQDRNRPFRTSAASPQGKYQWDRGKWIDTSSQAISNPFS
jgi:hypothetical protein